MEYGMEAFLLSCTETYEKLAESCGTKVKWDDVSTPFLDETQESDRGRDACKGDTGLKCPWCQGVYNEDTFAKVKKRQANHHKPKKSIEQVLKEAEERPAGRLSSIAAKVLMKVFYAARTARFDLYRPVAGLARHMTKWTPTCDKKLHRIMSYIKKSNTQANRLDRG